MISLIICILLSIATNIGMRGKQYKDDPFQLKVGRVVSIHGLHNQEEPRLQQIVSAMNHSFGVIVQDANSTNIQRNRQTYLVRNVFNRSIEVYIKSKYLRPIGHVFLHDFTNSNYTISERYQEIKLIQNTIGSIETRHHLTPAQIMYFPSSDPFVLALQPNLNFVDYPLLTTFAKCNGIIQKIDVKNTTQLIHFFTFHPVICGSSVLRAAIKKLASDSNRLVMVLLNLMVAIRGYMKLRYEQYPWIHETKMSQFNGQSIRYVTKCTNAWTVIQEDRYQDAVKKILQTIRHENCIQMMQHSNEIGSLLPPDIDRKSYDDLMMADVVFHYLGPGKAGRDIHVFGFDLQHLQRFRDYFTGHLVANMLINWAGIPNQFMLAYELSHVAHHPHSNDSLWLKSMVKDNVTYEALEETVYKQNKS
eukprot:83209_1